MRNQRAGQATFIPLDTIQAKPINDKFRSFAKGARLAVDVIQFDPAIERVARPLSAIPWRSLGMCAMNEARRSKVSSSVLLADHAADEIHSRNFGWDSHPQERFDHRWT
jgi:hypothetical protein